MRLSCLSVSVIVATGLLARTAAAEETSPPSETNEVKPNEAKIEHARVTLGLGLNYLGNNNTGVGSLGGVIVTGLEINMTGPLWFLVGAAAHYSEGDYQVGDGTIESVHAYGGSGRIGLLAEAPVSSWLRLGGYALARIGYSTWDAQGRYKAINADGTAGLLAHIRPNDFFGVRLGLNIFSVGRDWYSQNGTQTSAMSFSFYPSPTVDLTFTF